MGENQPVAGTDVVARLVATRPRLEAQFQHQRLDDDEELPYMQVAALARALVESLRQGDTQEFGSLFEEVEQILTDGIDQERELVVVGFLEDVQGALGWAGLEPNALEPWLGPLGSRAWNDLVRLWDDIRAKKAAGELPAGPFDHSVPKSMIRCCAPSSAASIALRAESPRRAYRSTLAARCGW